MKVRKLKELLNKSKNEELDVIVELSKHGESGLITDFLIFPEDGNGNKVFSIAENVRTNPDDALFDGQLRLGIPNEFIEFCTENHTTAKEVLHGFIADLLSLQNHISNPRLDKLSRNGDDESELAEQYFTRVGYQFRDQL
jgi:hypothetical protein